VATAVDLLFFLTPRPFSRLSSENSRVAYFSASASA
jgi:hypothetical protein